jgi:cysteine synthase A
MLKNGEKLSDLIGNTPIVKVPSLSKLTGSEIFLKCEQLNPGGSIKDRAALQMVKDALDSGKLKEGMTIVEGTAGNTGIGLAIVAKSFGLNMLAVMPKGQSIEKERMLTLHGAQLKLVDPCPFKDQNHFYHTARKIAQENPREYWWANQFENLSNFKAHYENTAPEIVEQLGGKIDFFITSAGTGGTIGGNSKYFKEKVKDIKCLLIDPEGSGLKSYMENGEFKSSGGSITEGIGIMRLVENFKQANLDDVISLPDQDIITVSQYVREHDGIVLGLSGALNLAGALYLAARNKAGSRIVTFHCDLGERSFSKLYNPEFLKTKGLRLDLKIDDLITKYKNL